MRKEPSMRRKEAAEGLKKWLKSMIVPFVLLVIIGIFVAVVMLYKEPEETEEIVKVETYEAEQDIFVLENDSLKLTMDASTTQFTLTVKETGAVWYSNPEGAENDSVAQVTEKYNLQSTLLLTYSNQSGVDTSYNNYTYSIERGIYDIEAGDDYIKVYYSIGDVDQTYYIPPIITEERMDEYLSLMSESDKVIVTQYYKLYDINNLGSSDDKDQLLSDYPILETETCYILRDTTKDNMKLKMQNIFEEVGYTIEDYAEDCENDLSESTSDTAVFNVNMVYRLDGDDLVVEVPLDEVEYSEDYPILYLTILPYFGAGGTDEDGYLFVPEGGGAVINFNNGKLSQNSYYANVYGWDMAVTRSSVVHTTDVYFPVYGVSKGDNSMICILEEGAAYASIQADVSGKSNSYNYVNAVYSIAHREQYDLGDMANGAMYKYEETLAQETLTNRYRFVDSGDYVDMAKNYQEYLLEEYDGYLTKNEDESAPLVTEIVGAIDKTQQVLGVPVDRPLALTTYSEAQQMLEDLTADGLDNLWVKYSGWMNGGIQQKVLSSVNLLSCLGTKKDFNSLTDYASANNINLYLDGVTNYAYNSSLLNGFFSYTDSARLVTNEEVKLYPYSKVTYEQETDEDAYYLLNASKIITMAQNLIDYVSDFDSVGVSFRDIGDDLSSDFATDDTVTRQQALYMQAELLKEADDSGTSLMINRGNDYAIAYCDMVTDMDLKGTEYTIIDYTVPFYQIVIHGYVNYTGEAINLASDSATELLLCAEYGAGLYFTLMDESVFSLQETSYSEYYAAEWSVQHEELLEIYNRYNNELGHVFNQEIVDHEYINSDVTCTTYEDGTKVYVNYGYEDDEVDGLVLPARDYTVVR